jgi:ribosomal protein S17E
MSQNLTDEYQSNKEVVESIKQAYETQKLKEYNFPTEIIELPSRGLIYPKDNPLSSGKIELKYMTAKEEDILTTQSYIRDGSVLDKLFQSLIISNGEGQPIKYTDLTVGDKNAIMISSRILGYGKDYEVEITDPFSGKKQKESIDLTQFQNKEYDGSAQIELNKNEFEFLLPHSKRKITFMALTESKDRKIKHDLEELKKVNKKLKDDVSKELTTRLKTVILSVDGEYNQQKINHFVDNELFALDSRELRKYINEVTPDVDLTYEFISDETGERREINLPMDVSFFWPST